MLDGRFSRVTGYADTRQATAQGDSMELFAVSEKLPERVAMLTISPTVTAPLKIANAVVQTLKLSDSALYRFESVNSPA